MPEYKYATVSRKQAINSAKRLVVDSIWKEANVEIPGGITFPETNEIFEGRIPEGADFEKIYVVNNLKRAWKFLVEHIDEELSPQLLSEYNRRIGEGDLFQDPGKLRTSLVRISGTEYQPPIPSLSEVEAAATHARSIENPIDRALTIFCEIVRSQFFNNGNKRTAQLAANHILIQSNCAVFAVPDPSKQQFTVHLIAYYESGDPQPLKDFLYQTSIEPL